MLNYHVPKIILKHTYIFRLTFLIIRLSLRGKALIYYLQFIEKVIDGSLKTNPKTEGLCVVFPNFGVVL